MFQTVFAPLLRLWSVQGRQDSVKDGVRWISPSLLNHGVSKGVPACVLDDSGESNVALLADPARMAELMRAIHENRVEWKHPEETALPHLWCLMKRGDMMGTQQLTQLIVALESELRIRFFPRILTTTSSAAATTMPFDRYAPISDLTVADLCQKVKRRISRVERYIRTLQHILEGFRQRRRRGVERRNERPGSAEEERRLTHRITDAEAILERLLATGRRLQAMSPSSSNTGLCKEDVDALARQHPQLARTFRRAELVRSLADLDLGVERWACQVPKHTGLAGSPTLADGATEMEQRLTDTLFVLSETVAKGYLVGTHHRRLTRTSYPWHIPASPDWSRRDEVRRKVREILTAFVNKFPGHPMPNPLVQAIDALLRSTGDTDEILPLKTIAQDLFRWGGCALSARYNEAARKAVDLVMMTTTPPPDGRSPSFYARAHGITVEHIDRIRRQEKDIPDLGPTRQRISALVNEMYCIFRHTDEPDPRLDAIKAELAELRAVVWEAEQPVSSVARQLMAVAGGDGDNNNEITVAENHLNSIHALTVPLLPAIQLGCIADPAAYVRGAWANIVAIHGDRPGRRAAPMISNLYLGLSLIEDEEERVKLFEELADGIDSRLLLR